MSKTFASNPSRVGRGRGSDGAQTRGTGVRSRPSLGVGRATGSGPTLATSGASQRGRRAVTRQPTTNPAINSLSNSTRPTGRGSFGTSGGARGRMDTNRNAGNRFNEGGREEPQEQQADPERRGQYAGGYTVFSPDDKKRRQISEMAQRETEAYERYKQANAGKTFSYVGTVGGGELSQDQARARQANQVRAQKFNRLMKQEERKQIAKRAEEESIQVKRDEARRKAELNAQRQSRVPPADEIRRKREAFLSQFENGAGAGGEPTSPERDRAHGPPMQPSHFPSTAGCQPGTSGRQNNSNNNRSHSNEPVRTTVRKNLTSSNSSSHARQARTTPIDTICAGVRKIDINNTVNAGPQTKPHRVPNQHSQRGPVRLEAEVKQEVEDEGAERLEAEVKQEVESETEEEGAERNANAMQRDEEIGILYSMYPYMDPGELENILLQMGSLDRAIEVLDFRG